MPTGSIAGLGGAPAGYLDQLCLLSLPVPTLRLDRRRLLRNSGTGFRQLLRLFCQCRTRLAQLMRRASTRALPLSALVICLGKHVLRLLQLRHHQAVRLGRQAPCAGLARELVALELLLEKADVVVLVRARLFAAHLPCCQLGFEVVHSGTEDLVGRRWSLATGNGRCATRGRH